MKRETERDTETERERDNRLLLGGRLMARSAAAAPDRAPVADHQRPVAP